MKFKFSDFLIGETTCDGKKMIRFVHMERRFERELESLWKRGGKAATTAQKAHELLAALTRNGPPDLKKVWKLTGWGEKRIEGCLKYDLGDGFRMICFKRGDHLYFSYVGTHDDCHRWLNRNRSRHNRVGKREAVTTVVEKEKPEKKPFQENREEEWDYDEQLMARVDEKILRKIFGGIWGKRDFNVSKVEGD
ncbi:MAG: hypothetical protein KKF00_10690 [Proteobacteria bacterium]|nr:hypothetical protein [Pseudomonadota bacterium]